MNEQQRRYYGLMLPHFGKHAAHFSLAQEAARLEALGYDSVWVRDHVVYQPHGFENEDRSFLDPIVVLSAAAGATQRIMLCTGTLIPHRHPLHAAGLLGSLDYVAGGNRVIVGMGLGSFGHEFEAVGLPGVDRAELLREQVTIMRALWSGESVSHQGPLYSLNGVSVRPIPKDSSLPIWYCGTSRAAVRRVSEYCDGWMPGSLPRREYRQRRELLEQLTHESGRPLPPLGAIPLLSPGRTVETAARAVDLRRVLALAGSRYQAPGPSGFQTLEDLDGSLIAGPADRIVEEVERYHDEGASHIAFDLRLRFDDWRECVEQIAEEVLPQLRAPGASSESCKKQTVWDDD